MSWVLINGRDVWSCPGSRSGCRRRAWQLHLACLEASSVRHSWRCTASAAERSLSHAARADPRGSAPLQGAQPTAQVFIVSIDHSHCRHDIDRLDSTGLAIARPHIIRDSSCDELIPFRVNAKEHASSGVRAPSCETRSGARAKLSKCRNLLA